MSAMAWRCLRAAGDGAGEEPVGAGRRTLGAEPGSALGRVLRLLEQRVGAAALDTLWLFPPRLRGRSEQGLVVAGCFATGEERRRVLTAIYAAERSGKGLQVQTRFFEEGVAPAERLPRIIDGVVRRSTDDLGNPRCVEIGGDARRLLALLAEFDAAE